MTDDGIDGIYQQLVDGSLREADLSARGVASLIGKTTGAVYHRWGSLDGLLFAVGQRGFADLGARLSSIWERTHDLADCAEAYVVFGLDRPQLYPLMFERRYDWAALRASGAFETQSPGGEMLEGIVLLL